MNVDIHNITRIEVRGIKKLTLENPKRVYYTNEIIITTSEGARETINLYSNDKESLKLNVVDGV